jgi:hypothetical protein|tara:strand:- start:84 stop:254 length:171 start_codon:yes stop_codon:yes gene_type:complete
MQFWNNKKGCGCLGFSGSGIWLFFTLMWFFTESDAIPVGKWEFVWRFIAGPINFLF